MPPAPYPQANARSSNTIATTIKRRDNNPWNPGQGTFLPNSGQQKGWFALFALLGAAMVLASIWFFFWAKNGGFVWRSGDWEDYKSTVLRRKGKDGKTLSNATPRTYLGHKSVAGTFTVAARSEKTFDVKSKKAKRGKARAPETEAASDEKSSYQPTEATKPRRKREHVDADVRAYRRERPARVGGLNRSADGSAFDWTNSERSELSSTVPSMYGSEVHLQPKPKEDEQKKKGFFERQREKVQEKKAVRDEKKAKIARAKARAKAAKEQAKKNESKVPHMRLRDDDELSAQQQTPRRSMHRRYSFTEVDSTVADQTEYTDNSQHTQEASYYDTYRPQYPARVARNSNQHRQAARSSYTASSSPAASNQGNNNGPRRYSRHPPGGYEAFSDAGTSETGTKGYTHHIPESSRGAPTRGFRRGMTNGGDRRDSLDGSDLD